MQVNMGAQEMVLFDSIGFRKTRHQTEHPAFEVCVVFAFCVIEFFLVFLFIFE